MKTLALGSFFVLFAIVAGITAIPSAFADHLTAEVSVPSGSSVPGCEETNECFTPAEVTVDVGGEVTWSNDDTAAHTVTSGSAADGPDGNFDSSLFMAGTTFSWTAETPGEYPYFCMVHPWMAGTVIVEAGGAEEGEMHIEVETGSAEQGEQMTINVAFEDHDGNYLEHVNYDIVATQGSEVVLDEKEVHDHDGQMTHTTSALPLAASDEMPVNVEVTFNGLGIDPPFTGPIGEVATKQVVPEFGTITMMVLGVAIVSIIAITAKSKIVSRI